MTAFTPLPGNADVVASGAQSMKAAAAEMTAAAATLRGLADQGQYRSGAIDQFRTHAGELATVMTKASMRYQGAGQALADYAPQLRSAQERALAAIQAAKSTNVGFAKGRVRELKAQLLVDAATLNPDEFHRTNAQFAEAKQDLEEQKGAYGRAVADYERAVDELKGHASAAAERIVSADEMSGLNDGLMDDLRGLKETYLDPLIAKVMEQAKKFLAPALKKLSTFLDELADLLNKMAVVLAVLAAVVTLIGVVFPPAAAVGAAMFLVAGAVGTLALGLSTFSLAMKVGLFLLGDLTFGALLTSALTVAASVLLKGKGKDVAGKVFKGGSTEFKEVVGNQADDLSGGTTDLLAIPVEEGLNHLFDDSFVVPAELWNTFDAGADAVLDRGASSDVSDISTDFGSVDVDAIMGEAFSNETVEDRGLLCSSGSVA